MRIERAPDAPRLGSEAAHRAEVREETSSPQAHARPVVRPVARQGECHAAIPALMERQAGQRKMNGESGVITLRQAMQ